MNETVSLRALLQQGFKMSGERVHVGFDRSRIAPTLSQLPKDPGEPLNSLIASDWPADSFSLGAIELLGPDRINEEHRSLLPGTLIVKFGFLCIGSDGGGNMYSFCVDDQKVYLIPHEYVSENAVYAKPWVKMEVTAENIKAISEQSWDSLGALFEWALAELGKHNSESEA